ncbi:MAG: NUDIX domain-containing protein [Candidatus Protochlamydia sp.]|nr:NUDIX domain-containing protein [Candidatus Protochlamydia sp.]
MGDIRSEIHQIVSKIQPIDGLEAQHIGFALNWIETGSEIFRIEKPATTDTHLVSYFVIVSHEMDQILLVEHIKAELWLPPGGHVEPGENPKEAVKREAMEELGIEAEFLFEDPLFLTVTVTTGNVGKHTDVSLWYVLEGNANQLLNFDPEEFHQIRWFGIKDIPYEKSDPHMYRFIEKLLYQLGENNEKARS